jgi:hypothetical protein
MRLPVRPTAPYSHPYRETVPRAHDSVVLSMLLLLLLLLNEWIFA